MDGVGEVTAFLTKLGLEQCVQAVVHNGFYTSMEALRGATYRAERAPDGALVHPSSVNAEIARGKRVDDAPWPPADWLLYREVK